MNRVMREKVLIDRYNAAILMGDKAKANRALGALIDFVRRASNA